MGLDDYLNPGDTIKRGIANAVEESLPKVKTALDAAVDSGIGKFQKGADDAIVKLRGASMDFVGELEKKWEDRLAKETKEQFKLLNRVLLYTLVMALISLAYAITRKKLGL